MSWYFYNQLAIWLSFSDGSWNIFKANNNTNLPINWKLIDCNLSHTLSLSKSTVNLLDQYVLSDPYTSVTLVVTRNAALAPFTWCAPRGASNVPLFFLLRTYWSNGFNVSKCGLKAFRLWILKGCSHFRSLLFNKDCITVWLAFACEIQNKFTKYWIYTVINWIKPWLL